MKLAGPCRVLRLTALVFCASSLVLLCDDARAASLSTDKKFGEAKPDQALVYLVREKRFSGSARTMFVYADQTFLGTLDNGSYTFAYLPPGKHLLWLNWAKINMEVDLEAGKTYYYSIWTSFDGLDDSSGQAFVNAVGSYATPSPNEIEKSADHIRDRYGKAVSVAAAKPDDATRAVDLGRRAAHVAKWPKTDLSGHPVLCVEPFVMADAKADTRKKEYLVDTAPARIAKLMIDELGTSAFSEVRQDSCTAAGAVTLRARITQYKPGSDAARLMIAGAGSAKIEMVVTLSDAASGNQLVEFEPKGLWAWGGAVGAARGIADLEKNVAFEVASYLKQMRGIPLPDEP